MLSVYKYNMCGIVQYHFTVNRFQLTAPMDDFIIFVNKKSAAMPIFSSKRLPMVFLFKDIDHMIYLNF